MKSIIMEEAWKIIVQAGKEIEDIQDNPRATQRESDLRVGMGNLKSDLCHDYNPISGGKLDDIPDEWVLKGNSVKSYKFLQKILNPPVLKSAKL